MEYFSPFLLLLKPTTKYCLGLWHGVVWYCHGFGHDKPFPGVIRAWGEKYGLQSGLSVVAPLLFLTCLVCTSLWFWLHVCPTAYSLLTRSEVLQKWSIQINGMSEGEKKWLQFFLVSSLLAEFSYISDTRSLRLQITLKGMGLWIGEKKTCGME